MTMLRIERRCRVHSAARPQFLGKTPHLGETCDYCRSASGPLLFLSRSLSLSLDGSTDSALIMRLTPSFPALPPAENVHQESSDSEREREMRLLTLPQNVRRKKSRRDWRRFGAIVIVLKRILVQSSLSGFRAAPGERGPQNKGQKSMAKKISQAVHFLASARAS